VRDVGPRVLEGTAWCVGAASRVRVILIVCHDRVQPAAMHHALRLEDLFGPHGKFRSWCWGCYACADPRLGVDGLGVGLRGRVYEDSDGPCKPGLGRRRACQGGAGIGFGTFSISGFMWRDRFPSKSYCRTIRLKRLGPITRSSDPDCIPLAPAATAPGARRHSAPAACHMLSPSEAAGWERSGVRQSFLKEVFE